MGKRMLAYVLGVLAVLAQAAALRTVWQPAGPLDPFIVFFAWQCLAAFVAALFVFCTLPQHRTGAAAFAHIFIVCLFLPVAGLTLFISMMFAALVFPPPRQGVDSLLVENPEFVTYLISRINHGEGGRLRARLAHDNVSTDDRMAAMVALRSLPSHITGGMLRDLLSDETEEIRLLAYGFFDAAEQEIMQEIFLAREKLSSTAALDKKAGINRRLAELHWELIYQNLVHGEVHRYTVERVEQYAHAALALDDKDSALWYLLGRCALMNGNASEAEVYFGRAQRAHFPVDRLLPWLGEAAFIRRDYRRISGLLEPLADGTTSFLLQPSVRYWSK